MDQIKNVSFNGALLAKHNAKLLQTAIENGTAPFLPDANGKINTKPIYNMNTGFIVQDLNLVVLQIKQNEMGYESNKVCTYNTLQAAGTEVAGKGMGTHYVFKNKDNDFAVGTFFFPEEAKAPSKINDLNFVLKYPQQLQDKSFEIKDVQSYMPAYFAACKSGFSLSVSPEVTEQFKTELLSVIKNDLSVKEKNPEIPSTKSYFSTADYKSGVVIAAVKNDKPVEWNKEPEKKVEAKKEQKQEHKQERKKDQEIEIS